MQFFDYLFKIIILFCNCNYFLLKFFEKIFKKIFYLLCIIGVPLFLISIPIFLIFCLFRLKKSKSIINNPLHYIDFNNFTNITNHTNYINITNITDIKSLIDFAEINKNITFQTDEYKIVFIDILLLIFYISNFILFIIIFLKKSFDIKSNFIVILLNLFLMIGDFFNFKIYLRLNKSFNKLFNKLETILEIKISDEERIKIINFQ